MSYSQPARTTIYRTRIRWGRVAGLVVVMAAIAAAIGGELPASPSPSPSHSPHVARSEHRHLSSAIPDGTTVFADHVPGVAKLDPALLGALRRAATAAAGDGVVFLVDSGWRSPEYQERLFREAVSKYGSVEEAARWVATPDRSAHVSGDAVDLAPRAAAWLSMRGAEYGLCQVYGNEPWHYELRPQAIAHGCPPTYADPTHDPRMRHE